MFTVRYYIFSHLPYEQQMLLLVKQKIAIDQ